MKISIIVLGLLFSTLVMYAGGDENANLSYAEGIENDTGKTDLVYTEKDALLMWQDQAYTDGEDGAYKRRHSVEKVGSWQHAKNYCIGLDYQGYSDWRLPTSDELRHVHHKSGQVFTYFRSDDFWTSTPATDDRYYVVYPADAYQYKRKQNDSNFIRCVRGWTQTKKGNLYRIIRETATNIEERAN